MLSRLGTRELVLASVGLSAMGLALIVSASAGEAERQGVPPMYYLTLHLKGLGLGCALALLASRLPLGLLRAFAYPLWAVAVVLLIATLIPGIGIERKGSWRWISLFGLQFQPLEAAKLCVVVALAHALASHAERIFEPKISLGLPALFAGVPAALLLLQPDFGGAVVICICAALLSFVAGARWRHLLAAAVPTLAVAAAVVATRGYAWARVQAWVSRYDDPLGSDYQPVNALLGFVSGGLFGEGLGRGVQRTLIPEAHNDYIFSVAGEELGLIGVTLILACFLGIAWSSIAVALRAGRPFATLLAVGAGILIWAQALLNAAVALDLIPSKGTTLPFVSFGRSSLVACLCALGLILCAARNPGAPQGTLE